MPTPRYLAYLRQLPLPHRQALHDVFGLRRTHTGPLFLSPHDIKNLTPLVSSYYQQTPYFNGIPPHHLRHIPGHEAQYPVSKWLTKEIPHIAEMMATTTLKGSHAGQINGPRGTYHNYAYEWPSGAAAPYQDPAVITQHYPSYQKAIAGNHVGIQHPGNDLISTSRIGGRHAPNSTIIPGVNFNTYEPATASPFHSGSRDFPQWYQKWQQSLATPMPYYKPPKESIFSSPQHMTQVQEQKDMAAFHRGTPPSRIPSFNQGWMNPYILQNIPAKRRGGAIHYKWSTKAKPPVRNGYPR